MTAEPRWHTLDAERGVWWKEYAFTKGAFATTMAFRGPEGLIVISPGSGLEAADYDELAGHGPVTALVANNAAHHLGQVAWRERFPDAKSYAAAGALATLAKKSPGVPFADLTTLSTGDARIEAIPGFSNGELLARVPTARGSVWYTGDLLTNLERLPGAPLRWLFTWSGSAPGFKLFKLGVFFFAKDKDTIRAYLAARLDAEPPFAVVPGHGPAVVGPDVADRARAEIARL